MQYRFCLDLTLMTIQQTAKNIPLSTQEPKKEQPVCRIAPLNPCLRGQFIDLRSGFIISSDSSCICSCNDTIVIARRATVR